MAKNTFRVAVNGLGRIGRCFMRLAWDNPLFEIAAINSRSDIKTYAHLLKYDSVYGIWDREIKVNKQFLSIDGKKIPFSQESDPKRLPWKAKKINLAIEATGKLKKRDDALTHLNAGAQYVLVTAPMDEADTTLVIGVNEGVFDPSKHKIISAASCTSVAAALVTKVLEQKFGINRGFLTTVHAVTGDQSLVDSSHKDLRRARAAIHSIIPTSTGVTKTIGKIFPRLQKKLSGLSLRVPVIIPSVLSVTAELNNKPDIKKLNRAFTAASRNELKGNLDVCGEPLVSVDFKQNPNGAIVDLLSTEVVDGRLANIVAWYDNEWGYANQLMNLLDFLVKTIPT